MLRTLFALLLLCGAYLMPLQLSYAQLSDTASWAATVQNSFRVVPDITYLKANNMELKVDVYLPRNADGPVPTFI